MQKHDISQVGDLMSIWKNQWLVAALEIASACMLYMSLYKGRQPSFSAPFNAEIWRVREKN